VIFVDSNVLVYAVGREHPLRAPARAFFREAIEARRRDLCTSAEALQELLHIYLPVGRVGTLDAALRLAEAAIAEVWPVDEADVRLARALIERHPGLSARDLVHLACCRRRGVGTIQTFDRALAAAFGAGGSP
jgi:predicted nucleic acid-binding protein